MKVKRNYKKLISSCAVTVCMAFAMILTVFYAEASEGKTIQYLERTYTADNTAPETPDGYLFAGWYSDADESTSDPISNPVLNETYYAKFVPAEVLDIKAQVSDTLFDTDDTNDEKVAIRFITTIDSLEYQHVGFNIQKGDKAPEDAATTKYVYKTIYAVDATDASGTASKYTPTVFHGQSEYFKTWTIANITDGQYDISVTVIPYWVTLDGTRVEGTKAVKTVNMGRSWIYVDGTDTESKGLGTYDEPFTSLTDAVAYTTPLDPTIILKNDITLDQTLAIDKSVTITTNNTNSTISFSEKVSSNPILVNDGGDKVIDVVFKGSSADAKLIIQGIVAGHSKMIMYLQNAKSVTMEYVEMKDATRTSSGGAAIYSDVPLALNNCTFNNCALTATASGGAINMHGGNLTANDCQFTNCTVPGKGGAINSSVQVELTGCKFTNCDSTGSSQAGGAINVTGGKLTADDCQFTDCSATGNGGAINSSVQVDLKGCTFTTCTSSSTANDTGGGAVYGSSAVDMTSCTFTGCEASKYGGAIYGISTVDLTDCTFKDCDANRGGAIYRSGANLAFDLESCDFESCETGSYGGAVYVGSENKINITSCIFKGNSSTGSYGGAVAIGTASSTLNIWGACEFTGNFAKGSGTHFGGAMLAPSNLNIKSGAVVKMTGNYCTDYDYGDAISINTEGSSVTTECAFIVEADAKLYVYDNPNEGDAHNDICTEQTSTSGVGNPTVPVVQEGGFYSVSAPEE